MLTETETGLFTVTCSGGWRLAAEVAACIGKGRPRLGYELPAVAPSVEVEFENTVGVPVSHLAVGLGGGNAVVVLAARAHHELTDAHFSVGDALGRLRREALVVVVVTYQDELRSCL